MNRLSTLAIVAAITLGVRHRGTHNLGDGVAAATVNPRQRTFPRAETVFEELGPEG
jgi:hypothetical protein